MTLDEAIEHADEQAKIEGLCECAMDHKQLANWLRELKEIRRALGVASVPTHPPGRPRKYVSV